jgi:hypothetical protein
MFAIECDRIGASFPYTSRLAEKSLRLRISGLLDMFPSLLCLCTMLQVTEELLEALYLHSAYAALVWVFQCEEVDHFEVAKLSMQLVGLISESLSQVCWLVGVAAK